MFDEISPVKTYLPRPLAKLFYAMFLMLPCFGVAQVDSLLAVFNDESLSDSVRSEAMFKVDSKLPLDSALKNARRLKKFGEDRNYEPAIALAYRSIGYRFYKQGQSDSCEFYWEKCLKVAHRNDMLTTLSKVYYNLIWLSYQTGEYHKGVNAGKNAVAVREKIGDKRLLTEAWQQLGQVYSIQGEATKALAAIQNSLNLANELEDPYLQGIANGILGNMYNRQGETEKAVAYTLENIRLMEAVGNKKGVAVGLGNLAGIYQFMGKFEAAEEADQKSLSISKELGDMQSVGISYINIGQKRVMRGSYAEGLEMIREGHDILEEMGDPWPYNSSMKMMGIAYSEMKQYNKALEWCLKAVEHATEKKLDQMLLDDLSCVYEAYEATGKYKQALQYYRQYKLTEDSLFSASRARDLATQETKFEYEKQLMADSIAYAQESEMQSMQIETQNAQLESERTQRFALYGGLGLLLLFGAAMYNRFQVTRKQRDTIDQQRKMVEQQKSEVESQRDEIKWQHEQLEEKNTEILDSIAYAKRIQTAILPPDRIVKQYLKDSFILYKPKDVVAGDFYWMETIGDTVYFAAADCTGHGVPGAMVSVICNNGLNRSVREFGLRKPGEILDKTRQLVIQEFEKSEEEVKDGMDISLCAYDSETGKMQWAGANNPLWIVRAGADEIEEIKADKQPIGKYASEAPFTTHDVQLNPSDTIYIFSDGYPDQFGGENGKKYKSGKFKRTLIDIAKQPISKQREILDQEFESWKGDIEQIDDVCVIGVKI